MNEDDFQILFTQKDGDRRAVSVGDAQAESLAELTAAAPQLKEPENLDFYCEAVNYLSRGDQYNTIHDPDAFRAGYERRWQSEDPNAPFTDGAPRLHDFGHCDLSEIAPPRAENGLVIFYVEDDFLGIPYRVTAPGPDQPEGEAVYDPLPMASLAE